MASAIHFYRRSDELKYQKEILANLSEEVDRFIKNTDKYKIKDIKLELDSVKIIETINDLTQLEKLIDSYINRVHRASKIKIRHWERQALQGNRDEIVGIRRIIIRKLRKLQTRVRLLKNNVGLFKFDRKATVIESVVKQVDNLVDFKKGEMNVEAGGGVILAVTLLLAFFVELVKRKETELE